MNGKFSRKCLCLAVSAACSGTAFAGPVGPVVTSGGATYNAGALTVTSTTAKTSISWQNFNVARNEVVNFIQPNAQSSVLNQVFNSFSIAGSVTSNGSVLFMNNGVVTGAGVNLDVVALLNSSLRFSQGALAARNAELGAEDAPSAMLGDGRISVFSQDPRAISSSGGVVMLNPGKTVELADISSPHLRVQLTAPNAEAINITRLVIRKADQSIYAGLFRAPAAARQAIDRNSDPVQTASAELVPGSPGAERFHRYAEAIFARVLSEYAQTLNDAAQDGGGLVKVASAANIRMVLPEPVATLEPQPVLALAKSDLEFNSKLVLALASVAPAREVVATLEPQPVLALAKSDLEFDGKLILALASVALAREVVATLEPQPMLVGSQSEPEEVRTLAIAAVAPRIEPAQVASALTDAPTGRRPRLAGAVVIVVAAAPGQQGAGQAAASDTDNVKVAHAEPVRRVPRMMTDFRGAIFHM